MSSSERSAHLAGEERQRLTIEVMTAEAGDSSEIEGEVLDRASVQPSIRRQLGLQSDSRAVAPAEQGIAELTVSVYRQWETPLDAETLGSWHEMVMRGAAGPPIDRSVSHASRADAGRLRRHLCARSSVLAEGPGGFKGGLIAANYISITKTSPATATRDLADLVERGALTRTGERRHTRYHLTIPLRPPVAVTIDEDGKVVLDSAAEPPAAPSDE